MNDEEFENLLETLDEYWAECIFKQARGEKDSEFDMVEAMRRLRVLKEKP